MNRWVAPLSVAVVLGIGAGWLLGRNMDGTIEFRTVVDTLPAETVLVRQPPAAPSIVHRVLYRTVPAETVLVSLPGSVDTLVQQFCPGVTPGPKPPALVLTGGRVGEDRTELFGFTNDGRAYRGSWGVRPPYEWRAVGDSVRLDRPRLRWQLPSLAAIGACAAAGAGGALIVGAIQ